MAQQLRVQVIKTAQNITGTIYRASVTLVKSDACTSIHMESLYPEALINTVDTQ